MLKPMIYENNEIYNAKEVYKNYKTTIFKDINIKKSLKEDIINKFKLIEKKDYILLRKDENNFIISGLKEDKCILYFTKRYIIEKIKYEEEILIKLRNLLNKREIDNKKEILKLNNLKGAHIYCKINELSGQNTGILIEYFIKKKYNMRKNDASSCTGDLNKDDINYEIKVSNGGKWHNKFNYVQLRINHNCDYLLTAYYLDQNNINNRGELFIFRIKKEELKGIILKYGSYAHGSIKKLNEITKNDLNMKDNNKEYAIRPKYNDECWKELLNFRINEIDI